MAIRSRRERGMANSLPKTVILRAGIVSVSLFAVIYGALSRFIAAQCGMRRRVCKRRPAFMPRALAGRKRPSLQKKAIAALQSRNGFAIGSAARRASVPR